MLQNTSVKEDDMAEDADTDDEKLLILPLNDRNSKKISQIISSDTARDILEAIASAPRSTTEIAEQLGIPLTTVQYNLEKLSDAGLVKVARTKYSKKMKPVKLYTPQRKLVVIVPEQTSKRDVIATLKRYLVVAAVAVVGSGAIELLAMRKGRQAWDTGIQSVPEAGGGGAPIPAPAYAPLPAPSPEKTFGAVPGFDFFAHPGLWFLFGCLFVILVMVLLDYRGRKRHKRA
ncbi:MAG: helix-turn-helix transcriptional regulator [Methanomicrobia archaeon]|nr:helix-turn-helix transcriptional regulator [Methanomicrobia archaeon]